MVPNGVSIAEGIARSSAMMREILLREDDHETVRNRTFDGKDAEVSCMNRKMIR